MTSHHNPEPPHDHPASEPTYDPAAETALLGAMLLSVDAVIDALEHCTADDLYHPLHQQLFALITGMFQRGTPIDTASVTIEAGTAGLRDQIGNGAYLHTLLNRTPSPTAAAYYATTVHNKANLRRIAQELLRGYQRTQNPSVDAAEAPTQIANDILTALDHGTDHRLTTAADAVHDAITTSTGIRDGLIDTTYYPTGYRGLDALITGIHPGQLFILGGRPGMGKSVAILDICRHIAVTQHQPVILFSLEMSTQEISQRLTAAISGVPLRAIRDATLTPEQEHTARTAADTLTHAPLYIQDSTRRTFADIRGAALSIKRKHGTLALIAIDYVQLLDPLPGGDTNKAAQAEALSRELKVLSRDLAPVLAASQLNRKPDGHTTHKYGLADLRWAGEQDPDVVMMLHRDDHGDPHHHRAGEVDLFVIKNRNGPEGETILSADLPHSRLLNLYTPPPTTPGAPALPQHLPLET